MLAAELIMGVAADRRSVQNEKAMSNDSGKVFLDAALRSWRSNMDRASKFFSSLTSEELELEVAPARNRLVYIWGHLAAVNDAMFPLFGFGQRRYPELDNTFVSPVDPCRFADSQRLRAEPDLD